MHCIRLAKLARRKNILKQEHYDFNLLDTLTLCKLLTTIVRADRVTDGLLISFFEKSTILNILKAIKQNQELLR